MISTGRILDIPDQTIDESSGQTLADADFRYSIIKTIASLTTGLTADKAKDYDPIGSSDGDSMTFNIEFMPAIEGNVQFR